MGSVQVTTLITLDRRASTTVCVKQTCPFVSVRLYDCPPGALDDCVSAYDGRHIRKSFGTDPLWEIAVYNEKNT